MIKQRDLLIIILLTFLTVAAWIGFNIYHISATSTISDELQVQILPINSSFDMNTINKLKAREQIEPLYQYSGQVGDNSATEAADIAIQPTISIEPVTPTINLSP